MPSGAARAHVSDTREGRRGLLAVLLPFVLVGVLLCFLGYGADNDSYLTLDAGTATWRDGVPTMSRPPGYWVQEALVFGLDRLGGALAVNLVTLGVSVAVLWRLWSLAAPVPVRWRVPLLLCLALNPWFLAASTSAMDYNVALLALVLAIEAAVAGHANAAGLFAAVAISVRLGSVFPVVGALSLLALAEPGRRSVRDAAVGLVIGLGGGGLVYLVSWAVAGDLSFLRPHAGPQEMWTGVMWLGRALYKPLALLGIPATLLVVALLVLCRRDWLALLRTTGQERRLCFSALGAAMATVALYLRYPIETSYLLPALAMAVVLAGLALRRRSPWLGWALAGLIVLHNLVALQLAAPDQPGRATAARLAIALVPGVLVADIQARIALMGCRSFACYLERVPPVPDSGRR